MFKEKREVLSGALLFLPLLFLIISCVSSPIRDEGIIAESSPDMYVGSVNCAECHEEKYDSWARRLKADFVRYREDEPGPLPGDWSVSPVREEDVFLVIGRKRKVAFVDRNWKVIPYEYHLKNKLWKKRKGWARENYDYRVRCAPCHTVGLNPKTRQFKELNIGCESCHGPGRMHVNDSNNRIRVPGRNDGQEVLFTCRKCHNNRKNHPRAIEDFTGRFHND